jgi:hypothetical protein
MRFPTPRLCGSIARRWPRRGAVEELFDLFDGFLKNKGYLAMGEGRSSRAYRNRKLSEAQRAANTTRSNVRVRVEHVFGDQKNGMGTGIVRTIGIVRARFKIGMTNLVCNMCLERMMAAAG